ncbi:hypothetical protein AB205_0087510 [Aquarana catesbeiana]|uniref:Uncharacterized protein n=1 Tax=Aquarana catesbeiana TaxID=8400 RepID=A0A2G9RXG0_AQUCT|nr:hypothetical protein AB205_0087510 [Aquarana catesbeiana]
MSCTPVICLLLFFVLQLVHCTVLSVLYHHPGQHDCVTVINNFFPREKLDYYTKPQGLSKEPKLPVKLAGPLHKIITTTNLHPVKIIFLIQENPLLLDQEALKKCSRVLDLICEKCMKQRDMNEVLAMKMHYISCILQKCTTFVQEGEDKLDTLVKSLLKGRDGDCFPVFQEKFIRESIRKFPFCEATLLQQLVRSIAPVEIGSDPTAFSVLTQAITGQVGFVNAEFCTACGEKGADKRCSVCKLGDSPCLFVLFTIIIEGEEVKVTESSSADEGTLEGESEKPKESEDPATSENSVASEKADISTTTEEPSTDTNVSQTSDGSEK